MDADWYPPGYRDPAWDGTEAGFRDVVVPARVAALEQGINDRYGHVLPAGVRFEWVPDLTPPWAHAMVPDLGGEEPPGFFILRLATEVSGDAG